MKQAIFICFLVLLLGVSSCSRKSGRKKAEQSRITSSAIQRQQNRDGRPSSKKDDAAPVSEIETTMSGSQIFEKYNSAVFMVYTSDGLNDYQGSGFFISEKGLAVSNYHVFQGTGIGYEQIKLSDGSICKLKRVIAKSEDDDFFIFEIETNGRRFNYIPISERVPKVGEKAYAIGSPRGLENTFSSGEISQFRGDDNQLIQISVPIDHGSSGGALINSYGEVIGITSAGLDDSGANLNFAVNISVIKKCLQ